MKSFLTLTVALSLTACGGGGGSSAPSTAPSPAQTVAVQQSLESIIIKQPEAKTFTGAFVTVDGKGIGYVEGKDKHDVVAYVVTRITDAPSAPNNVEVYRKLLSADGLPVVVVGEVVGVSKINGMTLYAPDSVGKAWLKTDGLFIEFK